MDLIQFIIFIGSTVGLFFWNRSESRSDMRHMDTKLDQYRAETNALINAIKEEMKDFHTKLALQDLEFKTRLFTLEEKNKK